MREANREPTNHKAALQAVAQALAVQGTAEPTVIAIDGRSAAGKTTLAVLLAEQYAAAVIHMDDFFLPPELRTPERMSEPGGNLHRERFVQEVLQPLRAGKPFDYRRFDCKKMAYGETVTVPPVPLYIVEGAYSCQPAFGAYMDLRVFCDITPKRQKERILLRNGAEGWQRFSERWIPMEERYFAAFPIREQADILIHELS